MLLLVASGVTEAGQAGECALNLRVDGRSAEAQCGAGKREETLGLERGGEFFHEVEGIKIRIMIKIVEIPLPGPVPCDKGQGGEGMVQLTVHLRMPLL